MQKKNLFLALGLGALALVGTVGASAKLLSKDAIPAYGALEKVEDDEYVYASFGYNKVAADSFNNGKELLKTAEGKNNGFSWSVDGNADHKWAVSYQNAESNGSSYAYYAWSNRYLLGASSEDDTPKATLDGVNGNLLTMSTSDPIWGGVATYAQAHNTGDDASAASVGLMMQYDVASLNDLHIYVVEQDGSYFGNVLYSTDQGKTWANAVEGGFWYNGTTATGITLGHGIEGVHKGNILSVGTSSGLALTEGAKAAKNVRLCVVVRNPKSDIGQPIHLAAITVNQSKALDAYLYNDSYSASGEKVTLGTAHRYGTGSDTNYMTYDEETSLLSYGITPSEGAQAKMDYISTYCVK